MFSRMRRLIISFFFKKNFSAQTVLQVENNDEDCEWWADAEKFASQVEGQV